MSWAFSMQIRTACPRMQTVECAAKLWLYWCSPGFPCISSLEGWRSRRRRRRWKEEEEGKRDEGMWRQKGRGGKLLTGGIRNVQLYWCQCKHISIEINRAALELILASNKTWLTNGAAIDNTHWNRTKLGGKGKRIWQLGVNSFIYLCWCDGVNHLVLYMCCFLSCRIL